MVATQQLAAVTPTQSLSSCSFQQRGDGSEVHQAPSNREEENTYQAVCGPLLHPDLHFPVVEHALQVVLERKKLLAESLTENIDFLLELCAVGAHSFRLNFSVSLDLGGELATRGSEEVSCLQSGSFLVSGAPSATQRAERDEEHTFSTSLFDMSPSPARTRFSSSNSRTVFMTATLCSSVKPFC